MNTIGIVGGGPAAISVCYKLLSELCDYAYKENIEIVIFEKGDRIGPGLPYSPSEDCYLLNLPVLAMSADFADPHGFGEWFSANFPHTKTQFPPRRCFGQYLVYLANYLQQQSQRQHISLKYFTKTEVSAIYQTAHNQYTLKTTNGEKKVNYIVLCTGHMPNMYYQKLKEYPGYRHDQWINGAFDNLDPDETVGIIGSRLSAIDVVLKLKAQQYKGKILMFSRSGLLPTVLAKEVPPYSLKYLTLDNLDRITKSGIKNMPLSNLLDLFWKEIRDTEETNINFDKVNKTFTDISAIEWINREIKQAEAGPRPWQQVMFAIYPISPLIWKSLSFSDKKEFMRNYYSLYMTYLAAFPLDNAYKIQEVLLSGQLQVVGSLDSIRYREGLFVIETTQGEYRCKNLFNAMGPGYDPTAIALYRQMYQEGLIVKHHYGGICVDPQTLQVFNTNGEIQPHLYAVGELTRGTSLATTDMTQLTRQVDRLVSHLTMLIKNPKYKVFSKSTLNFWDKEAESHTFNGLQYNVFGLFSQTPNMIKAATLVGCAVGSYLAASYIRSMSSKG